MMASGLGVLGSGGPVLALLVLISLFTVALIGVKAVQLRSCGTGRAARRAALRTWHGGDQRSAARQAAAGRAPADHLLARAMDALQSDADTTRLEADLTRHGNALVGDLERGISKLELVAMISPLLGLLGTVLGMIQAFQELELAAGSANAAVLAGGIWQALLTTAAGLIVALPAAVAASLLRARIDREAREIEMAVGEVLTGGAF